MFVLREKAIFYFVISDSTFVNYNSGKFFNTIYCIRYRYSCSCNDFIINIYVYSRSVCDLIMFKDFIIFCTQFLLVFFVGKPRSAGLNKSTEVSMSKNT